MDSQLTEISFEVDGEPRQALAQLFQFDEDGLVIQFGRWSSRPKSATATLEQLREWTRFVDYIMEGFVHYDLRVVERPSSVTLQIRTLGSNRDRHVAPFIEWSLKQIGLSWRRTTT